jgi:hypothetical protein
MNDTIPISIFVDQKFIEEKDDLICSICYENITTHGTEECSHIYCGQCILKIKKCSLCETPIGRPFLLKYLIRSLNDKEIKCEYCDWTGKFSERDNHIHDEKYKVSDEYRYGVLDTKEFWFRGKIIHKNKSIVTIKYRYFTNAMNENIDLAKEKHRFCSLNELSSKQTINIKDEFVKQRLGDRALINFLEDLRGTYEEKDIIVKMARTRYFEAIPWAREQNPPFPWDARTLVALLAENRLDMFSWCVLNGCCLNMNHNIQNTYKP